MAKPEAEKPALCEFCGGPEPCAKRACLHALLAQEYEDYQEQSDRDARRNQNLRGR